MRSPAPTRERPDNVGFPRGAQERANAFPPKPGFPPITKRTKPLQQAQPTRAGHGCHNAGRTSNRGTARRGLFTFRARLLGLSSFRSRRRLRARLPPGQGRMCNFLGLMYVKGRDREQKCNFSRFAYHRDIAPSPAAERSAPVPTQWRRKSPGRESTPLEAEPGSEACGRTTTSQVASS